MVSINAQPAPQQAGTKASGPTAERITISVDAMGGDRGPAAVVAGLALSARVNPVIAFLLHGDEAILAPLVAKEPLLAGRVEIRHASGVVTMHDKPSQVMRHGKDTSMWSCIDSLRNNEAQAAVSCGNTGALMAVSMIRLRKLVGVNRPAIACLWPSRNPGGFNVMLDVGADVKADPEDLLHYALMGASYASNGLMIERPRVGLLNVGTEEHKGRPEIHRAAELITSAASTGGFEFVGYVEGGDLPSERVDVIVTDGFNGNIALKTGEGTAKLMSEFIKEALTSSWLSKLGAVLALGALNKLKKRMDPRRMNGGVFLGLNGTVVKSHGSSDATGVSSAIKLAFQLAASGFQTRLADRLEVAMEAVHGLPQPEGRPEAPTQENGQ